MFGIGMPEMILILAVALIVIGPKKLPDLARSLGKALGEFKKATSDLKDSMQIDKEMKDLKTAFTDIDRDVKKGPTGGDAKTDDVPSVAGASKESTDAGNPTEDEDDPMVSVKAAFDRANTRVSEGETRLEAGASTPLNDDPTAESPKE